MSILRREPLGDLVSLRDAMDRLFEESLVHPFGGLERVGAQLPAVDVTETDETILVEAELPGVKPEDLDITVEGNMLTIRGETKEEVEKKEEGRRIYRERRYGSFCRSFTLPVAIKADEAEAEFEDGVLKLSLPKEEEAKRKSITVKSE